MHRLTNTYFFGIPPFTLCLIALVAASYMACMSDKLTSAMPTQKEKIVVLPEDELIGLEQGKAIFTNPNFTMECMVPMQHAAAKIVFESNTKQTIFTGFGRFLYNNGKLKAYGNYVDGLKEGWWHYLYANDCVQAKGTYLHGQKEGYWRFAQPDGFLVKEGTFTSNYRVGWWKFYDTLQQLNSEGFFYKGKWWGYYKAYQNKTLIQEGALYDGEKKGSWKNYNNMGKLTSIYDYD